MAPEFGQVVPRSVETPRCTLVGVTKTTAGSSESRYPGIPSIVDGSEAIAYVETRISEGSCAYPITPSTTMAAIYQAAVAEGLPNLWGTPLRFLEP